MAELVTQTLVPTLITEGSCLQGDLTFHCATQVHGVVEGDITQQTIEPLSVGRTGWVKGSIRSAGPVLIDGRVDGNISSHSKIRLSSTAVVQGILQCPQIEVRPGARFDGEFQMMARSQSLPVTPSIKKAA